MEDATFAVDVSPASLQQDPDGPAQAETGVVFVPCARPPRVGASVVLDVYLLSDPAVRVGATVVWARPARGRITGGFRARITHGPSSLTERIRDMGRRMRIEARRRTPPYGIDRPVLERVRPRQVEPPTPARGTPARPPVPPPTPDIPDALELPEFDDAAPFELEAAAPPPPDGVELDWSDVHPDAPPAGMPRPPVPEPEPEHLHADDLLTPIEPLVSEDVYLALQPLWDDDVTAPAETTPPPTDSLGTARVVLLASPDDTLTPLPGPPVPGPPLTVSLRFATPASFLMHYERFLERGEVYVAHLSALNPGTSFRLHVEIPDGEEPIDVPAVALRTAWPPEVPKAGWIARLEDESGNASDRFTLASIILATPTWSLDG